MENKNIISLVHKKKEEAEYIEDDNVAETIEFLERKRSEANKSLALVVYENGDIGYSFAGLNKMELVGMLEILKNDLLY